MSRTVIAVLLAGVALEAVECGVDARAPRQSDVHALLDVPYLAQTPELCGGAAVAMVLRYWGARDVFSQDFAPFIGAGDGGILTSVLASAVRDRGWQALVVPVDDDTAHTRVRSELDRGRPLIALVEVGPRTYHYVVLVGSTGQEVVMHDPARAPFRVLRWAEFDRAWTAAGRWMLMVLPPVDGDPGDHAARTTSVPAPSEAAGHTSRTPCGALVEHAVQLALAGDGEGAERGLVAATHLCPTDPASWLELAGLRFSQARWQEAQDFSRVAVRLAPDDTYAWRLLATSRYLMGDVTGALAAWNRTGEPRIDAIDVHGVERTRQPVVMRAAGVQPREILTPVVFGRALRRLRALPVASNARMRYQPLEGGRATLDVVIDERQLVPSGWPALAAHSARALFFHELHVDVAGSLGSGELVSAAWRWTVARPRVAFGLALPSPQRLPGVFSIEWSWERQSYEVGSSSDDATLRREERRRIELRLADWSTDRVRWQGGAALDRLRRFDDLDENRFDAREHLAVEGTLDVRLAGDRVALAASGGWWVPLGGGDRFGSAGLQAAWRSTDDVTRPSWSAVTGISEASRAAPLALWPGAGTGQGRSGLLRAHPLLTDGVLTGSVFGRELARGSLEYTRPVGRMRAGGLSIAGFVDAARVSRRPNGAGTSPLYVDAGVGLRVRAPGDGSAIRIDVAHGLRGGGATLSASWGHVWPW